MHGGFPDAYLLFGETKRLDAYENVHRFVMDKVINHEAEQLRCLMRTAIPSITWGMHGRSITIRYGR